MSGTIGTIHSKYNINMMRRSKSNDKIKWVGPREWRHAQGRAHGCACAHHVDEVDAWMDAWMDGCMHPSIHPSMHASLHPCIHPCVYVYRFTRVHIVARSSDTRIHTYMLTVKSESYTRGHTERPHTQKSDLIN